MAQEASELQHTHMQAAIWSVGQVARFWRQAEPTLNREVLRHLKASSAVAGGPARRLADVIWRGYWRAAFPRPAHVTAEENAFAHLRAEHDTNDKLRYHVWRAIAAYAAFRKQDMGWPVPLAVLNPLPALENMPEREHQRAIFKLATREQQQVGLTVHRHWLSELNRLAMKLDPNPGMQQALILLAELVWQQTSQQTGPEVARKWLVAQNAFWQHYHRNPWLAETPIATMVALLPKTAPRAA